MGLSPEEERHIQNLSLIPFLLIFYVFLGYVVYLIHINTSISLLFITECFMLVFLLVFPSVYFATEQVLRSHKEKRPLASYVKRFVGSMSIFIIGDAIFGVVWFVVWFSLASTFNWDSMLIVTYAVWISIWIVVTIRYRDKFNNLSKGNW